MAALRASKRWSGHLILNGQGLFSLSEGIPRRDDRIVAFLYNGRLY